MKKNKIFSLDNDLQLARIFINGKPSGKMMLSDRGEQCQDIEFWEADLVFAIKAMGIVQFPTRRVIQLTTTVSHDIIALCEDGTIWETDGDLDSEVAWRQISNPKD